MRKASWMSSPTVRRRRLPKCSYSSRRSAIGSPAAGRGAAAAAARQGAGLRGGVLDLDLAVLGDAELARQRDELAHQRVDVVVRQRAGLEVDVEPEARVELVAADPREVVALGVEEELVEQRVGR